MIRFQINNINGDPDSRLTLVAHNSGTESWGRGAALWTTHLSQHRSSFSETLCFFNISNWNVDAPTAKAVFPATLWPHSHYAMRNVSCFSISEPRILDEPFLPKHLLWPVWMRWALSLTRSRMRPSPTRMLEQDWAFYRCEGRKVVKCLMQSSH